MCLHKLITQNERLTRSQATKSLFIQLWDDRRQGRLSIPLSAVCNYCFSNFSISSRLRSISSPNEDHFCISVKSNSLSSLIGRSIRSSRITPRDGRYSLLKPWSSPACRTWEARYDGSMLGMSSSIWPQWSVIEYMIFPRFCGHKVKLGSHSLHLKWYRWTVAKRWMASFTIIEHFNIFENTLCSLCPCFIPVIIHMLCF